MNIGGKWKVDLGELRKGGQIGQHPEIYLKSLAALVKKASGEVTAGKYNDAVTARDALRARQEGIDDTPPTDAATRR